MFRPIHSVTMSNLVRIVFKFTAKVTFTFRKSMMSTFLITSLIIVRATRTDSDHSWIINNCNHLNKTYNIIQNATQILSSILINSNKPLKMTVLVSIFVISIENCMTMLTKAMSAGQMLTILKWSYSINAVTKSLL